MSLEKSANVALKKCMQVKKGEKILIITDSKEREIANIFFNAAPKLKIKTALIEIPIGKVNGEEPPKWAAEEMLKYDIILLITTKSLSHTKARKNASKKGARIASMPTMNREVMKRALDIDYGKLKEINKKLMKILTKGKIAKITTKKGTNLVMNIKGRKWFDDDGIYNKKGSFGNLPSGEVCVAPIEGKTNGVYIVDSSFAGIGKLKKPLKISVKEGYAVKIEGEKAKQLKENLKNKRYRNIAEFGIGTNPKARISGCVLEDEKVIGSVHIALGNNISLGGKINVPLHSDGVISKPTVFIDDRIIMKEGKLLCKTKHF